MTKQIPLSRGLFATVDDADFDWLSQWKWSASRQGRKNCANPKWRAVRVETMDGGKQRCILMHRQIAGPNPGEVVDHWDGNPLNNVRLNLRVCTQKENANNRNPESGAFYVPPRVETSSQKGVTWNKRQQKWVVQVNRKHVGVFTQEAAAIEAAKTALGEVT